MRKHWWKALSILLIIYVLFAGFIFEVPALPILHETIRNLYFHVTMWFSMMILMTASVVYSIKYLSSFERKKDIYACEAANIGMLFGILGIVTGMVWANFTWGDWWVNDPKLNGAAATLLVYSAYFILRGSVEDEDKRARISAVYNVFAYTLLIVFLVVLPRMTDSLHPGSGGNPGFSTYDIDSNMRLVFYPAVIGWTLLGIWIMQLKTRLKILKEKLYK